MAYVYIRTEPHLLTVGHYDPKGKWHPDGDYTDREEAAQRCAFLNGSLNPNPLLVELLREALAPFKGFTTGNPAWVERARLLVGDKP